MKLAWAATAAAILAMLYPSAIGAGEIPDVAGLRLGMTSNQVLAALRAEKRSAHVWSGGCVSDYLALHAKIVPISIPGRCPETISTTYGGSNLEIFLDEDIPSRPGVTVVVELSLNGPVDPNVLDRIVREAGLPDVTDIGRRTKTTPSPIYAFATAADRIAQRASGPAVLSARREWLHAAWCYGFQCADMDKIFATPTGKMLFIQRGEGLGITDIRTAQSLQRASQRVLTAHGVSRQP